jgi:hypothetical protein
MQSSGSRRSKTGGRGLALGCVGVNVSKGRRADLQASRKELPESAANRAFRVTRFASSPPKRRAGTQFAFASPSGIPALRRPSIVRSQKSRRRGSVCGLLSRAIHAFHAAVVLGPTARASASRPGRASAATKWKYAQSLFDLIAILAARSIRSRLALRQPGLAQGASHLLPKGGLEAQTPQPLRHNDGALKSALHCVSRVISVKYRSRLINGRGSANVTF